MLNDEYLDEYVDIFHKTNYATHANHSLFPTLSLNTTCIMQLNQIESNLIRIEIKIMKLRMNE